MLVSYWVWMDEIMAVVVLLDVGLGPCCTYASLSQPNFYGNQGVPEPSKSRRYRPTSIGEKLASHGGNGVGSGMLASPRMLVLSLTPEKHARLASSSTRMTGSPTHSRSTTVEPSRSILNFMPRPSANSDPGRRGNPSAQSHSCSTSGGVPHRERARTQIARQLTAETRTRPGRPGSCGKGSGARREGVTHSLWRSTLSRDGWVHRTPGSRRNREFQD